MTVKTKAKKALLLLLSQVVFKDDDLFPPELNDSGPEYDAWDRARNELVSEFERRAK